MTRARSIYPSVNTLHQKESLAGKGIIPDIEVEMDEERGTLLYYGKLDIIEDDQLQRAIKVLREKTE